LAQGWFPNIVAPPHHAIMMGFARAAAAALLATPAWSLGVDVGAKSSSLSFDAAGAKNRPVSKVVNLLKDMTKTMESEQAEDEKIYDKLACWCETNDKEKTKAVKDAQKKVEDLTTQIEELTASSSGLSTEIDNLQKEVAKNSAALDKATALREKQLAEFNAEEKDLLQSITALKAAVTVLSKHHKGSLLQMPHTRMLGVAATLQHEMRRHASLLQGVLSPSQKKAAASFVKSPEEYFGSATSFKQSYAPQSGEIFGILKQMQESFESNLGESQKEEAENQKAYDDLKAAKEAEIAAGEEQLDAKKQDLAETDEMNAHAKEDIEDTRSSLSADEQFLLKLKEKCSMTDKEFALRQKERQTEMEAVSKAIAILSSDDAHELFMKTVNPSFLQKDTSLDSEQRAKASKLLSDVAQRAQNPKLSALAYQVRLDAFKRVKKAIDSMVNELLEEKEDEIKHKDFCVKEFQQNQLQTEKMDHTKQGLLAEIEDLEGRIRVLGNEIESLKAQIAEMQLQRKRAGEDREKENQEYLVVVEDQRQTQKLLQMAMSVLSEVYGKPEPASFVQKQEPPAGFSSYSKSSGGGGALDMLKEILADAKKIEAEAIRSEDDMQKAYEDFVKDTNGSIEAKNREIVNKSEEKAKLESDLVDAKEKRDSTMLELEQLSNYNAQLHSSCDFVMKNFEVRQTARDEEIEALRQAKKILSGAKY